MDKVKQIIYLIVLAFFLFLGGKAVYQAGGDNWAEMKSQMVVLDEPVVKPENEGRLIKLTAVPTVEETLVDPEFDLEVEGAYRLNRKAQTYRYYVNPHNENQVLERWESTAHAAEPDLGNEPDIYKDETFLQDIKLGEFTVPADRLKVFGTSTTVLHLPELASVEEQLQWDYLPFIRDGMYYTTCIDGKTYVGDCRVRYEAATVDRLGLMTVVGMQKNGELVPYKLANGNTIYELLEGDVTIRSILNQQKEDRKYTYIGVGIVLFILLVVGLFVFSEQLEPFLPQLSDDAGAALGFAFMLFGMLFLTVCSVTPIVVGVNSMRNYQMLDQLESATAYVSSFTENNAGYFNYDYYYDIDGDMRSGSERNVEDIPFSPKEMLTDDGDVVFGEFPVYYYADNPEKIVHPKNADFMQGLTITLGGLLLGVLTCLAWRNTIQEIRDYRRSYWEKKRKSNNKGKSK